MQNSPCCEEAVLIDFLPGTRPRARPSQAETTTMHAIDSNFSTGRPPQKKKKELLHGLRCRALTPSAHEGRRPASQPTKRTRFYDANAAAGACLSRGIRTRRPTLPRSSWDSGALQAEAEAAESRSPGQSLPFRQDPWMPIRLATCQLPPLARGPTATSTQQQRDREVWQIK